MTKTFKIACLNSQDGSETVVEVEATSVGEALTMAERAHAGVADRIFGIAPDDYEAARAEGIEFNEADGLLI